MRACFIFSLVFLVVLSISHQVLAQAVFLGATDTNGYCTNPSSPVASDFYVYTSGYANGGVCSYENINSSYMPFVSSISTVTLPYGTNSMVTTNNQDFVYFAQGADSAIYNLKALGSGDLINDGYVKDGGNDYLGNPVSGLLSIVGMVMTVDSPNNYLFAIGKDNGTHQSTLSVFKRNTNLSDVNYGKLSFVQSFDSTTYPTLNAVQAIDIALGVVCVASTNAINFFYYNPATNNYAFYGSISTGYLSDGTDELTNILDIATYKKAGSPYRGSFFVVNFTAPAKLTPIRRTVDSGIVSFTKMPSIILPTSSACRIKVSPDSRLLVASGCTGDHDITIYRINSDLTLTRLQTLTGGLNGLPMFLYPSRVSFTPDGRSFYSTNVGNNLLLQFSLDQIFSDGFD